MQRKKTAPDLGQRLTATRSQSGLSQSDVAHRAGLAASYLSRIETGKIQPTVPTANKIAAALRVSLSELLGPRPPNLAKQGCPVSGNGICLLDLLDPKWEFRSKGSEERYSPRQLRLLRRFTALLREGSPELTKGLELLVDSLVEAAPQQRVRRRRGKTATRKVARGKAKRRS
ncbi:MAG: helix-turn-helix transcriptional regulator [Gemmatimonadota bacterium]|nr:MAG: helix-turn-helix transcriptional regulator [Gemmatimonadota bacterium]